MEPLGRYLLYKVSPMAIVSVVVFWILISDDKSRESNFIFNLFFSLGWLMLVLVLGVIKYKLREKSRE